VAVIPFLRLAALTAAAAAVAAPFVLEAMRREVGTSDNVVRLSQGRTHFRWTGPQDGPVVVAVHGLTTPSRVYDAVARGLVRAGCRVLVYDLYGRGASATVAGRQDQAFFLRQLDDLLAHERVQDGFTLIGYSMGGAIATAFTAAHPERVRRLVLLAPAGVDIVEGRLGRFARRVPGLGDWLHSALTPLRMRRALEPLRDAPTEVAGIVDIQLAELKRKGFLPAVLSSYRFMLAADQEDEHRRIAQAGVPVLAIWGETDDVIPPGATGLLAQWNPHARQNVLPGAGHGLPYTHGAAVVRLLADTEAGL
jgi:pimeloyl-ACP methyl ester carboxylesterase